MVASAGIANAKTVYTNLSDAGRVSQRYCVRHRHGDRWHSCSDTRHPRYDQSHYHTGLPAYYPSSGLKPSNGFYFGVKSGSAQIDIAQSDVGMPKGVVVGFSWIEYALEFEASSTSVTVASPEVLPIDGLSGFDSSYTTTGVYGVRRIGDAFYTKMKVGLSRSRYEVDGERRQDSSPSAGFGIGWRVGTILLEGEYTYIGSSAKLFSIGANIVF